MEREVYFSSWKCTKQNPSKPREIIATARAHRDSSAFRLPLPIILSNKLIVMPVQIFIMNQLTGRFSIGSISRKHFPIWRNNREAFRNDERVEFFFFFLLFRTITIPEWTFVIRLQSVTSESANFRVDGSLIDIECSNENSVPSKIEWWRNEKKKKNQGIKIRHQALSFLSLYFDRNQFYELRRNL